MSAAAGRADGPPLVVRDLTCRYADPPAQALAGVSLDAAPGELVAIMGASGAGKSTLLRCINALVPSLAPAACDGEIRLGAQALLGAEVGRLGGRVAMVFQDFEAQLFSTNVRLEVAFGPGQLGVAPDEIAARVERTLALVDLADFGGRDPSTLSGGQKQRLAIASILAMEPEVLLLDEPATDLDPIGRRELYAALEGVRGGRLVLLAVEHDVDPVVRADRLILMQEGRVVATGPAAALVQDVELFLACGVRPHDLAVLGRRLGCVLPLDVEGAVAALRARGLPAAAAACPPVEAPPAPPASGGAATPAAGAAVAGRARRASPILEVRGLTRVYEGGTRALDDVGLALGAGEFVALIGQNGSGKTTLAKHLNGLLQAQTGEVRLAGADLRTLPLERIAREVGYVFQNPDHQLFAATVADEVAFGPRNFGLAGDALAARVDETLAAVGLTAERNEDPFLLRKGERQRLAVATVLAMAPRVLILDEPTTGLDYPQVRAMLELLARLRAAGTTIVVITHSPWVVVEYAERALLMRGGRLVFDGALDDLLADEPLLRSAAFEAPPAARVARALGISARTVDALARALGAGD
ncbi:MAG: energy-coupling factor ABC transporter ATP-binding protein [Deltaproteobacteria bacterium]|nr:energy-coupling factor ABC transporter ATP-binding protein [Deltaproteobacteria bacterium]